MSASPPDLTLLPATSVPVEDTTAPLRFSFVSLVTNPEQYTAMVESFIAKGFTTDICEYLYGDNRGGNAFDGFSGLNRLIRAARGTYVICLHQDVVASDDGIDVLEERLADLHRCDPNWGVAANAGRVGKRYHLRISDKHGMQRKRGDLPSQVDVVDENFFILRRDRLVFLSYDLKGFHLYGLDIVLKAQALGLTAYAIDFLVTHMGAATVDERYLACQDQFEAKMEKLMPNRVVQTLAEPIELRGHRYRFFYRSLRRYLRRQKILRRAERQKR